MEQTDRIRCDVRIKAANRSIRPKPNLVGIVVSSFLLKKKNDDPPNVDEMVKILTKHGWRSTGCGKTNGKTHNEDPKKWGRGLVGRSGHLFSVPSRFHGQCIDDRERSCAPELLFRNACRLEIMRIAVFGVDPPYSFYLAAASATTLRELAAFSF